MKTKKFEKKLVLSKKTIVNLNGNAMTKVLGGATTSCVGEPKCKWSEFETCHYTCFNTGCMC